MEEYLKTKGRIFDIQNILYMMEMESVRSYF